MAFGRESPIVQTSPLEYFHRLQILWLFHLEPWPGRARLVGQPAHAGGKRAVQHQSFACFT